MEIRWALVACFAAAALVECLAPLLLGGWLAWRCGGKWRHWLLGAGVFLVFQGVLRVPLLALIQTRPAVRQALQEPLWLWLFLLAASFTAGLVEEGGRWVAYRWLVRPEQRRFSTGLMLGAGHGGAESIVIGLLVSASLVGYLVLAVAPPKELPPDALQEAQRQFQQMASWEPLLGAWERLATLAVHLGLSVMVLLSFNGSRLWWWGALSMHTLVNFSTLAVLRLLQQHAGRQAAALATEGLVILWAAAAVGFLFYARGKLSVQPPEPTTSDPAFGAG